MGFRGRVLPRAVQAPGTDAARLGGKAVAPRTPLLSAALIVRNEQQHLAACLKSIRALVDEIVIVDTGSTDSTLQIARQFGARIFRARWTGDFAAARNRSLAHATGQWILYIDADERLRRPANRQRLRRQLRNGRLVALSVDLHPSARATAFRTFRLFRRDPRIRFAGAMHETMMRGVERVIHDDGATLGHSGLVMDHVGYEGDQKRKARRNLPILRRALAEDPRKLWNLAHLGLVYATLGRRREAIKAWQRGIDAVRRSGSTDLLDSLPHLHYAGWLVANGRPAGRVLREGLARFPNQLELQWIRARWLMTKRRWVEAIPILRTLLTHRGGRRLDRVLPYPAGIFGADALAALGTCYFQLHQYQAAARCYARAHRAAPDKMEYRVKTELARMTARRKTLAS